MRSWKRKEQFTAVPGTAWKDIGSVAYSVSIFIFSITLQSSSLSVILQFIIYYIPAHRHLYHLTTVFQIQDLWLPLIQARWTVVQPWGGKLEQDFHLCTIYLPLPIACQTPCFTYSFCVSSSMDSSRLDDEHKLIARYAQRLAQEARTMVSPWTFIYVLCLLSTQLYVIICFNVKARINCSYYLNSLNLRKPIKAVCYAISRLMASTNINFITASLTASYCIQNVPGRSSGKYAIV